MSEGYKPEIILKDRDGQISLWVNMPDGFEYNIWEIPKAQFSGCVFDAIKSAFHRGMKAKAMQLSINIERILYE